MSVFSYQAIDSASRAVRGTIAADSPREAREKLSDRGLFVEVITPSRSRAANRFKLLERPSRYATQLASAVRELSTLLAAGIGLVDALDTLAVQYRGRFQSSLMTLRERVASGTSLSDAMRGDPGIYDELTIEMTRVGESAGTLDTVLDRLADFRERYLLFKDRVTTALVYPTIIVVLAIGVSIFLMTIVLPMLLENLVESGRPLPWPTRVLKAMSDAATGYGIWLLAAGGAMLGGIVAIVQTRWGRRRWHRFLFALPVVGPLSMKQELARTAVVMATLMENGIVFVDAAQIAGRAAKNVLLRDALDDMRDRVQSGRDIGEALAESGLFPPLVVQIFTVGQQTGRLEEMLHRLADGYERQVASATSRLTAALEPILIVFLAIVVGFILFATILPILDAGNVF